VALGSGRTSGKGGVSQTDDVRWGADRYALHETVTDFLHTQAGYFRAGLNNGEFCIRVVFATTALDEAVGEARVSCRVWKTCPLVNSASRESVVSTALWRMADNVA
jgi:hypothetical protein